MRIRTVLLVAFIGCGMVPLIVACAINYATASDGADNIKTQAGTELEAKAFGQLVALREVKKKQVEQYFNDCRRDMDVLVETVNTLRDEAFMKLVAVRQIKRAAVERYFQSIEDQVVTFSEDKMIVDAARNFCDAFRKVRDENNIDAASIDKMRDELVTYYTGPFAETYRGKNGGQAPNARSYFDQLDDDSIVMQYYYIQANANPLGEKHKLDAADDASAYSKLHAKIHPIVRNYLERFGYYDIFIADPKTGDIVYSVFKELDYSTSLIDGPYAQTNFGEAFRRANEADSPDDVILVDYACYTPSYEAPASFIASPIYDGATKVGVALFQMPIDRLNNIMTERAGLGRTGETYLVGPDLLMRSDSYLDPDHHSVEASFRDPATGKVDTTACQAALANQAGAKVIIDYNGNPVLSAYCPVDIGGITWALLAEIDVAEAFCPKVQGASEDFFTQYNTRYGYYDLFLFDAQGYCFYTVAHEADYQTNLLTGPYKDSNLGQLVREVVDSHKFGFADFAPYAPSNGDPAAFIAQPIIDSGQTEAIVALQLPLDPVNRIMHVRDGMGETGETVLIGPDKLMRSDSLLAPTSHTVAASFANPQQGSVATQAVSAALAGQAGTELTVNYADTPVLSAYTPVDVFGTTWALLAEVDQAEALRAVKEIHATGRQVTGTIIRWTVGVAVAAAIAVVGVAILIAGRIVTPIRRIITGLNEGADQVNDTAGQVANASQQLASGASQQASSLQDSAEALENMTSMTRQNADDAQQARELATKAHTAAGEGDQTVGQLNDAMKGISESSDKISKIIKVIEEIAFQTNLLALNAAVEAARAGEHGKGFAVVADEVRNLAQRCAQAAGETTGLIGEAVNRAEQGTSTAQQVGKALSQIVADVSTVTDLISGIAAATENQAQGVGQISSSVSDMDRVTQENASNAEESASASQELAAQAGSVKGIINELVTLVEGHQP